jgi:uncharacterized protein YbjT (DUF2867 family)
MNILLTGATGFIGNQVLWFLVQQGHTVTACCRYPEKLLISDDSIKPLAIDFGNIDSSEQWLPYLNGIDAVINCVGIIAETATQTFTQLHTVAPIALFEAAAQTGVKKIIQISALGADEQATTPYHLSKKAADDALRGLSVQGFILQPSIVYGAGARSSALLHALAALPVHLLPDGGGQLLQPVAIDDVLAAVARCLEVDAVPETLALVGAEAISYADFLQGLRRRLGKQPAYSLSVSYRQLLAVAGLGRLLGEPILSKDTIAMLSRGNSASTEVISAFLHHPPASLEQQLFSKPATQAERWHAQLYFLKPVLGFTIALVWLWSGIISLFFYPHELSYRLLAATGISGIAAPVMLYGLAILDIGLGVATLCRYRLQRVLFWQIVIVLGYSVVVALMLPEFLIHPFGALLKNLPFVLCLVIYRQLTGERP